MRDLSWLDYSLVRDMSADGRTVLFTEGGRGGGANYGVYLRRTDGSPAVRLGDGDAAALSPDGKWAITSPVGTPRQRVLQPTGPGRARPLTEDAINHLRARWFPDGSRIASAARYCTMTGIAKVAATNQPYVVANELICGRLGLMLGLPIPPGG